MRKNLFILLLAATWLGSCSSGHDRKSEVDETDRDYIKYASGFSVAFRDDGCKLVEIHQAHPGASGSISYLLVPKDKPVPTHNPDVKIIRIPLETIVCTSTTHIPLLEYLEVESSLVGFPSTHYISSERTRERIGRGLIQELGVDKGMDLERLAMLKPELVMAYSLTGDAGQFRKMEAMGIPVLLNAEYLERHPLGRAEWIKFVALLYNRETLADSIFNAIEKAYLTTKSLTETIQIHPTVISGIVYGDTWFMPGGKNYAAQLLQDAGFHYYWSDNDSNGFLELSFESVFNRAYDTDYWIGVGSFTSLKELADADSRYTQFNAFKKGNVFTYDYRKGATGGSEFLELGYLRPDIILNDLVKIAFPDLLPDHELYFHHQLN
ncbi:MAG: ABC transporter substrate-binding protein [Cyclobacteriaceae bacterium]|nr:ABC transporter substrate-binding protein [Cyclobacteriaceae bacterium]